MNYRHVYHAGNFADVLKHTALVAVLLHLRKKASPFCVIDAHAGRGFYDIGGMEANKTGEAANGVMRLSGAEIQPGSLSSYCEIVRSFGEGNYPGSPLIAAKLLRDKDRLIAIEKQPDEYRALASILERTKNASAVQGDYAAELPRLLPPRERRGLVLIDPPYEAEQEFAAATRATIAAHAVFSNGVFLFWYPAKSRPMVAATIGEFQNAGISALLQLELDVDAPPVQTDMGRRDRLSAAGLFVINPPFGLAEEMRISLPYLATALAQGRASRGVVKGSPL